MRTSKKSRLQPSDCDGATDRSKQADEHCESPSAGASRRTASTRSFCHERTRSHGHLGTTRDLLETDLDRVCTDYSRKPSWLHQPPRTLTNSAPLPPEACVYQLWRARMADQLDACSGSAGGKPTKQRLHVARSAVWSRTRRRVDVTMTVVRKSILRRPRVADQVDPAVPAAP
jgi:hypothetical protein